MTSLKVNPKIFMLIFFCVCFYSSRIFANDSDTTSKNNKSAYCIISPNNENDNYLKNIIPAGISVLSIIITWLSVRKQIKSVEKNIIKKFDVTEVSNFKEIFTKTINEILEDESGNLRNNSFVSKEHRLYVYSMQLYLDTSIKEENELLKLLMKFRNDIIVDKDEWVEELVRCAKIVIEKKKNSL